MRDFKALNPPNKKPLPLKAFRLSIANVIHNINRKGRSSAASQKIARIHAPSMPKPPDEVRQDQVSHFPIFGPKKRCRNCQGGITTVVCTKCNLNLCFTTKRNCFLDFHSKK